MNLDASSTGLSKSSTALFYEYPEPEALTMRACSSERLDNCELWTCDPLVYAKLLDLTLLSAGVLGVSGLLEPVDFAEVAPGRYEAAAREGALWSGADPITLQIEGSDAFPAMQASLRGPSLLTVLSPTGSDELVLQAFADLSLLWSKRGASNVYARLSVVTASEDGVPIHTRAIDCNFGATLSSGDVPWALLQRLPKPPGFEAYRLDVFTSSFVDVSRADAKLWFQATEFGLSRAVRVESAP